MSHILHRVLRMDDVAWGCPVTRIPVNGEICNVCHREYSAFLSFKTATGDSLLRPMKFVNLPCGCVDPVEDSEVASDVLVRLILVAGDR